MTRGWIDIHGHYSPPLTGGESDARWRSMQALGWQGPKRADWSLGEALRLMDRFGIQVQMLSNIPKTLDALKVSNDFGASVVAKHPGRFGLLAAVPTDDPEAALAEIDRAADQLGADGYAVSFRYNGSLLSDSRLEPVFAEFNRRRATVFAHPDGYCPGICDRPSALVDVTFETAYVTVDMLYSGLFQRYPNIRFILAHCGGALAAITGRLALLCDQSWVCNPNNITPQELRLRLSHFYYDTAMAGSANNIAAAVRWAGVERLLFGTDIGAPSCTEEVIGRGIEQLKNESELSQSEVEMVGLNGYSLFSRISSGHDHVRDSHRESCH